MYINLSANSPRIRNSNGDSKTRKIMREKRRESKNIKEKRMKPLTGLKTPYSAHYPALRAAHPSSRSCTRPLIRPDMRGPLASRFPRAHVATRTALRRGASPSSPTRPSVHPIPLFRLQVGLFRQPNLPGRRRIRHDPNELRSTRFSCGRPSERLAWDLGSILTTWLCVRVLGLNWRSSQHLGAKSRPPPLVHLRAS